MRDLLEYLVGALVDKPEAVKVEARADLAHKSAQLPRIDFRFSRPRAGGLPREVRVHGSAAAPHRSPSVGR